MHEHELKKNALVKGQVLIISTSHDALGDTGSKTGTWLEEVAAPYYVFKDNGYDVTICSIKGGAIPVDAKSLADNFQTEATKRFSHDEEAQAMMHQSVPLDSVSDAGFYDVYFLPGGHGVCWDCALSEKLGQLLSQAYEKGKVISAVCHGPVGLVNVKTPSGEPLVAGKKVTGFTNTEEEAVGLTNAVPWLLEDKLKELGGKFERGPDWTVFAVSDGQLVTGQNPQSSEKVATLVMELLTGSKGALPA